MTTTVRSGLHLCPGCCEKRIPAQRDLCYLCEALDANPVELSDRINAAADRISIAVERTTPKQRKIAKRFGAVAFALLISFPFWARAVYEYLSGIMQ